ncbi:MAG: response regulator transcription factor [Lachnospiraceae bacterium]|nr:response regulator transcription factor [Lachnospiraceae bacterium]
MLTIYYAEDEPEIALEVQGYLREKGFRVFVFETLARAREALEQELPAVMLVDWNMPDGRGDSLCRWIRSRWSDLPVIFLTVRGEAGDVVRGFEHGADDYVVKPFALEVLHSRICALLRRSRGTGETYLSCGGILLDQSRMGVFCGEEEISLSQAEYQLLRILMRNKGRTVTRERLLEEIWDSSGSFVNDNTLTVAMKRLREKLHKPACLKTVRSFGYRMEDMT